MATVTGTSLAVSHYNGGWVPTSMSSYSSISSSSTGRGYGGGSYYFVMKFNVPKISGATNGKKFTFKLGAVNNLHSSGTTYYAVCTEGKTGSTYTKPTVPTGTKRLTSGSISLSGLTPSVSTKTFTTSAFTMPNDADTLYLWVYGGSSFEFYGSTSHFSVSMSYTDITNVTEPTVITATPTLFDSQLTLNWSGAKAGTNNAITSYYLQRRTSPDGKIWGSWEGVKTVETTQTSGSYAYTPNLTGSYFIQFRIRTQGKAGSSYYSAYKESTKVQKKPAACQAPMTITVPSYYENVAAIKWSGAAGSTGNTISAFRIEHTISEDGETWGEWVHNKSVALTATSGATSVTVQADRGSFVKIRIRTQGTAGDAYYSEFKESTVMQQNILATGISVQVGNAILGKQVTITWNGAQHSTGGIKKYVIQKKEGDAQNFTAIQTVDSNVSYGSYTYTVTQSAGTKVVFAVVPVDVFDVNGEIGTTGLCTVNSKPNAPTTASVSNVYPGAGETITVSWSGASDIDNNLKSIEIDINGTIKKVIDDNTGSGQTTLVINETLPEEKEVQLSIIAVDSCGEKSEKKVLFITRQDSDIAVGIGAFYKKAKCYFGQDGKWKKASIFLGQGGKWGKISAKEVEQSVIETETKTGNKVVFNDTAKGIPVKGTLYACFTEKKKVQISTVNEKGEQNQKINIGMEVEGIQVEEGGDYTDKDGIMWTCDEFSLTEQKLVKRVVNGDVLQDPITYEQDTIGYPTQIMCCLGQTEITCTDGELVMTVERSGL